MFFTMADRRYLALLVVKLLVEIIPSEASIDINEPVCTSRYDYEYKVMRQLVTLDVEHEQNRESITSIQTELTQIADSRKEDNERLRDIQSRLSSVERQTPNQTPGSTYIRWGKTSCPGNGSELVYKGFAAGSHYQSRGAASTYLCLPEEPTWNVYDDKVQRSAPVWGAEYEFLYRDQQTFFGENNGQKDVPCCVCYTNRPSVLMIPGRNICYAGWTLEYHGYLVGGQESHHATEFVCLDEKPEALGGGAANEDGKLFYFAEARCGPLKCPPYVNGRELTCAICSK